MTRRDLRWSQERLLHPTPDSTASLASLLNEAVGRNGAQGEVLLALSAHNLHEKSVAALLDHPDRGTRPPPLPLVVQSDIDTALKSIKEAAAEVSLHASILWNPLDARIKDEETAIAKYAPVTSTNDDEVRRLRFTVCR